MRQNKKILILLFLIPILSGCSISKTLNFTPANQGSTSSIPVHSASFSLPENQKMVDNPFNIIDCEYEPKIYYWYWYDNEDFYQKHSWEEIKNIRQSNFYITCHAEGTGKWLNAYVFRKNKLIFKQEEVARGRFFVDTKNPNDFYLIEQIINVDAFSQPLGYVLQKLQYDSEKNELSLEKTTKYPSYFIKYNKSNTNGEYYNKNLYDFEMEHNSDMDTGTFTFNDLDWSSAVKFEPNNIDIFND